MTLIPMVTIIIDAEAREQLINTVTTQGVLLLNSSPRKEEVVGAMTSLLTMVFTMTIIIQHELMVQDLMIITYQVSLYV